MYHIVDSPLLERSGRMYIQPTTNIRLLKGVPLDTTYDHTIYFASKSAQYNYFVGLQKYNLTNYTYQRVKKGVARVGIKADNLYDCNYMMFQNTAYGDKWFYAFITAVEFVNNECAEIYFELDVMQTWFFDCEPDYCFVEREHPVSDQIGEHYEPESVNTGEYVFNDFGSLLSSITPMAVIIMVNDNSKAPDGNLYDGIYGGCSLHAFNASDASTITGFLDTYNQKPEAVVAMYMCPVIAVGQAIPSGEGVNVTKSSSCYSTVVNVAKITENMTINGYKPKCKKLYTYPYNFYSVNAGRQSGIYRYELFEDLLPQFKVLIPISYPVQVALRPMYYKGCKDVALTTETLTLTDYPLCSWSTDAFRAWLAQNSLPITTTAITSGLSIGLGASELVPKGAGTKGVNQAGNLLMQGYQASIKADITRGNVFSGSVEVASGTKNFYGGRCSITAEYAKMIDDYFYMFGYAVNRCKKPNRNSRPHWNYVKTVGATVTGSVPADDMRKICDIYDSGITFWKNGSEVGQYNLDNTV